MSAMPITTNVLSERVIRARHHVPPRVVGGVNGGVRRDHASLLADCCDRVHDRQGNKHRPSLTLRQPSPTYIHTHKSGTCEYAIVILI